MTYTVTWSLAAMAEAERVVASRPDPGNARKAVEFMEWFIRRHPYKVGESRETRHARLWYEDVFGMLFKIDPVAMTVRVLSVGPARRH